MPASPVHDLDDFRAQRRDVDAQAIDAGAAAAHHATRPLAFATRQLHAGLDDHGPHRPRATPIHLSAGFVFDDFEQGHARFSGEEEGFSYTRVANPTNAAAERRIADLESGIGAILVGSGQAAIATTLLTLLSAGDHVVSASGIYEGTRELLRDDLARLGVTVTFVDRLDDLQAWAAAVTPATKLLFAESISNPRNEVADIEALAGIAHGHGIPLVIDNTLATPYLLRPIEHGADIVVHSASKFLAGHGTVLGGVIVDGGTVAWRRDAAIFDSLPAGAGFLDAARRVSARYGPSPSPLNAFLLLQGVETLSLRVQRQSASAAAIAQWLAQHPAVASVDYSGLPTHPAHEIAARYLPDGYGSVFAVTLRGGRDAARAAIDALQLFTRMAHLGDVRSLVLHPGTTTHVLRDDAELAAAGIGPGMLRLSIGIEEPADLLADLEQALAAASAVAAGDATDADAVTA